MKFRITATSLMLCYGFFEEHTQRFVQKYPQLKELVETEQIKEQEDECYLSETTIDIKSLDELLSLVDSVGSIVIYKADCLDEKYKPIKDDKYTIEIYDDYRE